MNKMISVQKRILSPIVAGLITALILMLIGVLFVSVLLMSDQLGESSLTTAVYLIHGASLLAGGWVAGRRKGKRGWYHGGLLGIVYWLLILIIGFLSMNATIHLDTLITAAICLITGTIGGMFGVNMHREKR